MSLPHLWRLTPARRRVLGLFMLCLSVVSSAGAQLQLGSISFSSSRKSRALTQAMASVIEPGFYLKVGGVAFAGVAEAEEHGLTVVGLEHDPERPDGSRLTVRLRTADGTELEASAHIHDWQLTPIARFADSRYNACVTLFGDMDDPEEEAAVREGGGRVISYHPAFEDTLLGLRLLQADMLVFVPDAADLFKTPEGYILGAGEEEPGFVDLLANQQRFAAVDAWIDSKPQHFTSYVVGDKGQTVTFGVHEGLLTLSGEPFWDCWRFSETYEDYQDFVAAIPAQVEAEVREDFRNLGASAMQKWNPETYRLRQLQLLNAWPGEPPIAEESIQSMTGYSRHLTRQVHEQGGINPVVYASTRTVMRFAAFFRLARHADPEGYQRFLATLPEAPEVSTPTVTGGV